MGPMESCGVILNPKQPMQQPIKMQRRRFLTALLTGNSCCGWLESVSSGLRVCIVKVETLIA